MDRPPDWADPARVRLEPDPIEEQETLPLPDKVSAGLQRPWETRAVIAGILLFAVVASVLLATYPRIIAAFDPYSTGRVTEANLLVTVTAPGTIAAPTYQVAVPTATSASAVKVTVGQTVTEGQVLVQLSGADLQAEVNAAQTEVSAGSSVLSAAQNALFATQTAASSTLDAALLTEQNSIQSVCRTTRTRASASTPPRPPIPPSRTRHNNNSPRRRARCATQRRHRCPPPAAVRPAQAASSPAPRSWPHMPAPSPS